MTLLPCYGLSIAMDEEEMVIGVKIVDRVSQISEYRSGTALHVRPSPNPLCCTKWASDEEQISNLDGAHHMNLNISVTITIISLCCTCKADGGIVATREEVAYLIRSIHSLLFYFSVKSGCNCLILLHGRAKLSRAATLCAVLPRSSNRSAPFFLK
ncbi:uncharacterized protein [Miscanthus floridulus]|uniref:uncharacterized protein isoform X1 n=1 Tax=Miscanthus floridulus TaxID=154761 RepID=UPI0034575EB6